MPVIDDVFIFTGIAGLFILAMVMLAYSIYRD